MRAKMEVLEELREMAMGMMGEGMEDYGPEDMMGEEMQQVTVAADDKEGLLEGLDKAEDIMEEMPEGEGSPMSAEGMEEYSDEEYEEEYGSEEDIDRKIAELEEMKRKMRG
jgi:hypothetical protein